MNYPAASCGVSIDLYDIFSQSCHPFIVGPARVSPGFPLKHAGMTDLGLAITQQAAGIDPMRLKGVG
jgi:hypothetical protein